MSPQRGVSWLYQLCLVLILLWTAICFAGACYGLMNIASEPTPTDPYAKAGRDVGTAIGLGCGPSSGHSYHRAWGDRVTCQAALIADEPAQQVEVQVSVTN